jgi:hypothetical protein
MPGSQQDYDALVGKNVLSSDGRQVGLVKAVFHPDMEFELARGRHYLLLEPSLKSSLLGKLEECYIPEHHIVGTSLDGLVLDLTEDDIRHQRWDQPGALSGYRRA